MKIIISFLLLLFYFSCFSQKALLIPSKEAILKDSNTNCTYVLDSTHTYITAYNSRGDFLWSFYTCISNFDVRHSNIEPIKIIGMRIGKTCDYGIYWKGNDEKVIWISHDMCSGFIEPKTGRYQLYGCD